MKNLLLLIALFFVYVTVFGQVENRQIITPEMELKFKTEIEKQVPAFKKQLLKEEKSNDEIEFTLDTFRINQFVLKRMVVDFTTQGMNYTVRQQAISYDKLMNKYYSKLLNKLSAEDKKVLVAAQKAWIIYRDLESKLIWRMTDSQYSGGGTIQTNFATDACANLIIKRTQEIFNYYLTIVEVEAR
jgi:uncharacterized protein YecT (DUF1311 family)